MQSLNQLVIDSTDPKSSDYVTPSIVAIAVGPGGTFDLPLVGILAKQDFREDTMAVCEWDWP